MRQREKWKLARKHDTHNGRSHSHSQSQRRSQRSPRTCHKSCAAIAASRPRPRPTLVQAPDSVGLAGQLDTLAKGSMEPKFSVNSREKYNQLSGESETINFCTEKKGPHTDEWAAAEWAAAVFLKELHKGLISLQICRRHLKEFQNNFRDFSFVQLKFFSFIYDI